MELGEIVRQLPIGLALLVWGIEWYALGSLDEILAASIPLPVPEHWTGEVSVESIVGARPTFTAPAVMRMNGVDLTTAVGAGALLILRRQRARLDEAYQVLTANLLRRAVEDAR